MANLAGRSRRKKGCPTGGPYKGKGRGRKLRKGWRYSKRGGRPIRAKRCR